MTPSKLRSHLYEHLRSDSMAYHFTQTETRSLQIELQQRQCCSLDVVKLCSLVLNVPIIILAMQPVLPTKEHVFALHTYGLREIDTPLTKALCLVLANDHYQV